MKSVIKRLSVTEREVLLFSVLLMLLMGSLVCLQIRKSHTAFDRMYGHKFKEKLVFVFSWASAVSLTH